MATATQIKAFIKKLGALAVNESNRRLQMGQGFVLPSVCIAQSALETGWGTSGLMTRANAYFGIKAGGSWTGKVYTADTWEVADGESYNTTANFRAYDSLQDSVADYYGLIQNARYRDALSFGLERSKWKSAKQCITAIWAGGYATDTLYVEKIMSTINARNLTEFDALVDGTGVYNPENPDEGLSPDFEWNALDDLVVGTIVATDSGRSLGNDNSSSTNLALDVSKMAEITADTAEYVLTIQDKRDDANLNPLGVYIVRLNGDSPRITGPHLNPVTQISAVAGEKIGFYLENKNNEYMSPPMIGKITLTNVSRRLPNGEESFSTPLAFFTEIT